ncbi:hypothetical protein T440DRAFT_27344 [Plenodomus tracheiphilus IPT5]|uniref:Uncharacterized protein n=1 Tax=Plenodomus tracheiphilus IPT5 TaxID=1408161 RepID=A0A6A7ANI2_9PLEO|nr:hypothetical protein T440DRAFT_27344 [Plenodomus tracheiphilus IPT5]
MRHSARVNARIRYSKIATCTVLSLNEYSTFSVLKGTVLSETGFPSEAVETTCAPHANKI